MQQDYYRILGVSRDATITEIKKAYKKLVFKYHPDRNRDNLEEAEAVMKEVNIAYEILSDENKRAEYDRGFSNTSSNYSSNGSGDLSFKIGSRTINYNQDIRLYTAIKNDFEEAAIRIGNEFLKRYISLGNLDAFHENGYQLGMSLISVLLNKSIEVCATMGRYDINIDRFIALDIENLILGPWTIAFLAIDKQYIEIQNTILSEEERRELRKESRARMVGAGFGLKNAVIASMEAGAVNLATGAIHSIFNSIGNAFTRASANNKKRIIYNNEKTFMILKDGIENSILGIGKVLSTYILELKPFQKDVNFTKGIIDNIKQNRIPKNCMIDAIIDALEACPFEESLYIKGRQYLSVRNLQTLNDMAKFFGIDAQRELRIKQLLTIAETYKENNNMDNALKWYERAAVLDNIEAIKFLGKYYLEEQNNETLAVNYLEKAANLGDIESLYELGEYYYNKDEDRKAVYYFRQVIGKADKGTYYYNEASSYLGTCYFNGWGTEKDYKMAYNLLLPLTLGKNKDTDALVIVAECYFKGLGIDKNIGKALELYTEAANHDDEDAQIFLVEYYCKGGQKNYVKALPILKKLVENDNEMAKMQLAKCYFYGYGVATDYNKAIELLDDIDLKDIKDDTKLAYSLGECYYKGINNKIDYQKAIYLLEPVAAQGDINAQYYLGMSHYKLNNIDESVKWLSRSASRNNSFAKYQMALFYFNGIGVNKDYKKAFEIFSRLIHQNHKGISYYLGLCYLKGLGTDKNYDEAIRLLNIANEEGNINAVYELGQCYYYGYGVEQNYTEAIKYFTKSAKANDKNSWYMLAVCYEKGIGVKQSAENAFKFYYKAASLGQNDAVFAVGRCYENAIGTEKNIIEAIKYYETAGKAGNNSALKQLNLLTEQKSVQKEVNKYNKAVEKEIKAEEKAAKREEQKNSIKEGCSTGCGCLIWIIIIYFIYQWLFD